MKSLALFLVLALSLHNCLGGDVPELKAVLARYDAAKLSHDEATRAKFVMELAKLRWKLSGQNNEGWMAVDAELRKHPAPSDTKGYTKARVGQWLSPRHEYTV